MGLLTEINAAYLLTVINPFFRGCY